MPLGIILLKWDNEIGTSLLAQYPQRYKVTERLLMSIYSTHRLQSNEPSFAVTTQPNMKISSFYSGLEGENFIGIPNHIVALLLRKDENPLIFKDILKEAAGNILKNVDDPNLEKIMSETFDKMRRASRK
ncbi:MAG: hypothetical protein HWN67_22035 [Candidatus Helarchaeota archaeon]|nr:hypothetical protein [Candidatus Helarchaeota archaeon]